MDNTVQEARIHTNDLNNVATAAAAASIHLNTITSNNSHNNITNTNIQVLDSSDAFILQIIWSQNFCVVNLRIKYWSPSYADLRINLFS